MANSLFIISLVVAGLLGSLPPSLADTNQLKVQGPWAYMRRSEGPTNSVDYLATTSAIEDRNTFLVLGCSEDQHVSAAIIRPDNFGYQLRESPLDLSVQLDDSPVVTVPAVQTARSQLTIHPQMARELIPLIFQSKMLIASVPETNGPIHTYSFLLQPNDLALREIGLRCYHRST
jgi:hypothetical protein